MNGILEKIIFANIKKDVKFISNRNTITEGLIKRIFLYKRQQLEKESLLKFENLNHYRDFISPHDISKILLLLWKKKYNGIINIASGKPILLKKIVLLILKRMRKKNFLFYDNKKKTSLVADISRLRKITGVRSGYSMLDMLFKV